MAGEGTWRGTSPECARRCRRRPAPAQFLHGGGSMVRYPAAVLASSLLFWPVASQAVCPQAKPNCGQCATLFCDGDTWDCAPKAAGTACNDGSVCTTNDQCDGFLTCSGVPISCNA